MSELLPAILVHDEASFRERVHLMESVATTVHLDVMDGAFVPQTTWFDADVLRTLNTPLQIELHLMVRDPALILERIHGISSIIRTLWHIEVETDHDRLIHYCHDANREAGLAISPKTPLDRLPPFIKKIDEILVMGNEPGLSGQALELHTVERTRELHASFPSLCLGFDIGVNRETIPLLRRAGTSRFCAASAIFQTPDPRQAFQELSNIIQT